MMEIIESLDGEILLLQISVFTDERGAFFKLLDSTINTIRPYQQRQLNYVQTKQKFTCRGLHYQTGEFAESKIFRVLNGSIQVVVFNIDEKSVFFKHTFTRTLSHPAQALWIPKGYATGYCTLDDDTDVLYSSDTDYFPQSENGLRWNDPSLNFTGLPLESLNISAKDRAWKDFVV